MTVIAWDGRTLAADKMACSAGFGYTVTKLHRLRDGSLVALSGDCDHALALLAWLNAAQNPAAYPDAQKDSDTSAFVVRPDGSCWSYGKTAYPQRVEDRLYAMGHGRDFALAALHCGLSAREAVELTCRLDVFCGNGVDVMTREVQP